MNPLLWLFGLLGLGFAAGGSSSSSSSSTEASASGRVSTKYKKNEDPTMSVADPVVVNDVVVADDEDTDDTPPAPAEEPQMPSEPEAPDTSDPVVAEEPQTPAEPETPDTPDPVVAEDPQMPSEPETPDTPDPVVVEEPQTQPEEPTEEPTTGSAGGSTAPQTVDIPQGQQQDTDGDGGESQVFTILDGQTPIIAGRVATLQPAGDDIVSVSILSGVQHGNVTVNPDNTFAVVMTQSDFVGNQSFTYEALRADGSTTTHSVGLNVTRPLQAEGWGTGERHYMLATDENDHVIVEHGDEHHKVYVTAGNNGLSVQDIARMEGMSANQVNGEWLANSAYGQSENLALDENAGMMLWREVTPRDSQTSNWLLLERGHEYDNLGRILERDTHGESENHPLHVGAWGEGERPEVTTEFFQYQESSSNVVVQDIHFSGGVFMLYVDNMIFDNIKVSEEEMAVQIADNVTIHNSDFVDVYFDAPSTGGSWNVHTDRAQGLYMGDVEGVLLEGNFFDHNGWEEGYNPDSLAGSGAQPPSMWSHNMYLSQDVIDVTLRDTITMRGASTGALIRGGGFIENNAIIDNNVGLTYHGGDDKGAGANGNYTLATDNVITSGAHKLSEAPIGGVTFGIRDYGELTSLVDNIVAHLADPNNAAEQAEKTITHSALQIEDPTQYNDTIVYNWEADPGDGADQNIAGLDTNILDQTTIQLFTQQLLGQPNATIADLADYLRAQGDGAFDDVVDADLIIRFFQEGFGIAPDIRATEATLRFVPDELGEGVRWDNRLNWDTEDLPGLLPGDDVDLGGNHVVYGLNSTIDELDFGPGGELNVYGGRLDATGGLSGDGGELTVEGAGQAWIGGSDGSDIDIDVEGGRFVNTDTMFGVDLTATGGQTVLATGGAEFEVSDSKTLAVFDAAAEIGFDGDDGGIAILDIDDGATLAYSAQSGGLGTIEEFRTGAMGDDTNVQSGIDLGSSTLSIDLSGLTGGTNSFTLMDADEIVGVFDEALIGNLGGRNANVVIDYENDTVTLQLSSGNGSVSIETIGEESDVTSGQEALWNALTAGQGIVTEEPAAQANDDDIADAA